MNSPVVVFFTGLLLLILFGWYFVTDNDTKKRWVGTALAVILTLLCALTVWPPKDHVRLGLDLQGGTAFLIRLVAEPNEKGEKREISKDMLEQAVEVIRKRVDKFGVSEPVITPEGTDRILVQIPGLSPQQIQDARDQLKRVAKLEFRLVHRESDRLVAMIEAGQEIIPPGYRIETYELHQKGGKPVTSRLLVKQKPDLMGTHVTKAFASFGQQGYEVALAFDSEGSKIFGELTAAHVNERLAIVLDGKVQSAPNINQAIYGGTAQITGNFTEKEARELASVLENPLQTPVTIEEERSISPTLGTDSIRNGVYAGVWGLVLTLAFALVYYRFAGLVANIALLINIVLLFGAMTMFNFVLTLPGIAGIILTIGMAIDANVLIFERLREEMAAGKSLAAAMTAAYEKAFSSIFDANVTTLITALILFWKATGTVRGFAITLSLGILASLFTALIVTRTCFSWTLHLGLLKRIRMMHLISSNNLDFLGKRRIAILCSVAVIVLSIVAFALRGEKNFGIDFKGGDYLVLKTNEKIAEGQVRDALKEIGQGEVVIQTERSPKGELFLTVRSPFDTSGKIEKQLLAKFPTAGLTEEKNDRVGAVVGRELATNALLALGLGIVGILIFVTARFEFSFALGAIVALLHDVIITVGAFALFGRELSLVMVGAVLTIAGYSINDTIVVYDRIREGIRSGRRGSIQTIMNDSINQTLSRTLLTSGTTLIPTLALFFFGGPVLHDFAFAILVGIIVGTYSSIFIASPIVLWWSNFKGHSLHGEVKAAQTAPVRA